MPHDDEAANKSARRMESNLGCKRSCQAAHITDAAPSSQRSSKEESILNENDLVVVHADVAEPHQQDTKYDAIEDILNNHLMHHCCLQRALCDEPMAHQSSFVANSENIYDHSIIQ